jgi:hypothetical protein
MKRNAPLRVVEVNITEYVLKQVNAIGREQRPKIQERCCDGTYPVKPVINNHVNLPLIALKSN